MKNKLLSMGYSLLPLHTIVNGKCTCGRPDCSSPGKHPLTKNGIKDATSNETEIATWSSKYGPHNVGVSGGRNSNLLIVDLDLDKHAGESLEQLEAEGKNFPETFTVSTGNGLHLYFQHPPIDLNNKVSVVPGIDIRADGGYVVAPGSIHSNGKTYSVIKDIPTAELPKWAIDLIKAPKKLDLVKNNGKVYAGEGRNNFLFTEGRSLRAKGWEPSTIDTAIRKLNNDSCNPPIVEPEISTVIKSITTQPDKDDFKPKEPTLIAKIDFSPIRGDEFGKIKFPPLTYFIEGLIPMQSITMIGAPPKAGKTTFLYPLLSSIAQGKKFLDLETKSGKVLLLAVEESEAMVQERMSQFDLFLPNCFVWAKPLVMDEKTMVEIKKFVVENQIDLVAIDTLATFAKFEDENDNAETTRVLAPLLSLRSECGVSMILVHHTKKGVTSGGDINAFFRGASAITATPDVLIALSEVRSHGVEDKSDEDSDDQLISPKDYQRKLFIKGRMSSGSVTKIKIRLNPEINEFELVGKSKGFMISKNVDKVYLVLNGAPISKDAIIERTKLSEKSVRRYLDELIEKDQAGRIEISHNPVTFGYIRGTQKRNIF